MTTLRQLKKTIDTYLEYHGNKELLSVSTYSSASSFSFGLNVCDIYTGPIGQNPFSGRESIKLYRDDTSHMFIEQDEGHSTEYDIPESEEQNKDVINICRKLTDELQKANDKSIHTRISCFWSAVILLQQLGMMDTDTITELWMRFGKEFVKEELGLEMNGE